MKKEDIVALYYISHKDNLPSILKNGIYSHNEIQNSDINPQTIYDEDIINRRKSKTLPNNEPLINYANLYLQPRNPMLYRVLHEKGQGFFTIGADSIVLIQINSRSL